MRLPGEATRPAVLKRQSLGHLWLSHPLGRACYWHRVGLVHGYCWNQHSTGQPHKRELSTVPKCHWQSWGGWEEDDGGWPRRYRPSVTKHPSKQGCGRSRLVSPRGQMTRWFGASKGCKAKVRTVWGIIVMPVQNRSSSVGVGQAVGSQVSRSNGFSTRAWGLWVVTFPCKADRPGVRKSLVRI